MRHECIDTNGIFDCCHCGARAKIVCDTSGDSSWRVECSECAEASKWVSEVDVAMVVWNKAIRERKKELI